MSFPTFHLSISGSVVAAYAAVVSTITGAVQVVNYFRDRAHIVIRVQRDMEMIGDPRYKGISLTIMNVVNAGRRPITITSVGAYRLSPHRPFDISDDKRSVRRKPICSHTRNGDWTATCVDDVHNGQTNSLVTRITDHFHVALHANHNMCAVTKVVDYLYCACDGGDHCCISSNHRPGDGKVKCGKRHRTPRIKLFERLHPIASSPSASAPSCLSLRVERPDRRPR